MLGAVPSIRRPIAGDQVTVLCAVADDSTPSFREILVPDLAAGLSRLSQAAQGLVRCRVHPALSTPSIIVDRLPARTTAPHGMTGPELERLSGAIRFMELYCQPRRSGLWLLTTSRGSERDFVAAIQKRITRLQRVSDFAPYSVTVFETSGGLHAHIVFIGNVALAERLKTSKNFGELVDVRPVTDPNGLARKYLAKERTPQAGYRRGDMLGGRLRGSHRLAGGGDRVRLSEALEDGAIAAGYVEPWQRTNARRSAYRKDYRPRQLKRRAPRPAGQLSLLPELKPVSRLRDFGGGFVPPAVALEIEFYRRRRLGLTQQELAGQIGCSQGQLANALRGHDPISRAVVNRLRKILLRAG